MSDRLHLDPVLLRRLLRAKDRMTAAPHEAWPITRLARVSGVSASHFAHGFKAAYGIPPHRFLLTVRMERAQALLRDTDTPVTEVALTTGWSSVGTFGRTFREIAGETPTTWREREQARAAAFAPVPACVLHAGSRPERRIAGSERYAGGDEG